MARFIQPQFFTPAQLDAITGLLDRMAISDEEGRRIFVIALEYELAEYEKERAEQPEVPEQAAQAEAAQPPPGPELESLVQATEVLVQRLRTLPEADAGVLLERLQAHDPYRRHYPGQYLPALVQELERLLEACAGDGAAGPSAAMVTAPPPAVDAAGRHFVLAVAEAFEECFETDPAADGGTALGRLLQQVIDSCGLPLRLQGETLQQLLEERRR